MSEKKSRVDSVDEAIRIASAASEEIQFPENVPLDDGDVPFFKNVIAEYVFDQAAVKAAGGPAAMEAMRRNLKGYANGGPVGISVPSVPTLRSMSAQSAGVVVNFNPVVDNRGASVEAVARQEKALAKMQGELQSRVEAAVRSAQKRNVKLG